MPSMLVRFTPQILANSDWRTNLGAFPSARDFSTSASGSLIRRRWWLRREHPFLSPPAAAVRPTASGGAGRIQPSASRGSRKRQRPVSKSMSSRQFPSRLRAITSSVALMRRSPSSASFHGSRSPFRIARIMAWPVTRLISPITLDNWTFIVAIVFCICLYLASRFLQVTVAQAPQAA
jgi:hypothetical protein